MNTFVLVAFAVFVGLACARPEEKYTTKYDQINLDDILKSDRLVENYCNCLLEAGTCTPDGEDLKKILPDAVHNKCAKCNDKQREGARKVIHFLIEKKPECWTKLEAKYDKEGTYKKQYEAEIKQEGLKI